MIDMGDYEPVKIGGDRWALCCRCGGTYKKVGRRFVEVGPDGTHRPYLVWRPIEGW